MTPLNAATQMIETALDAPGIAEKAGAAIAAELRLRPMRREEHWSGNRYDCHHGTKTERGLAKTVLRLIDESLPIDASSDGPGHAAPPIITPRLECEPTPGPYITKGDLPGVSPEYAEDRYLTTADFDEDERTGSIIAVLRGHGPQLRANARLLKAAPELRDALALAEATIERLAKTAAQQDSVRGTLDVIRAALATTEGARK